MDVRATTQAPLETDADTIVVGVFEGKGIPHDVEDGALGALVRSGEARPGFRKLTHTHAAGRRWILIGLGARDDFDAERARIAAAVALGRARELGTRTLCWELPHKVPDAVAGALVEGTLLAAYRYLEFKGEKGDERPPGALIVSAHHDVAAPVAAGRTGAAAANRARDLGNAPANTLTPEALAARARELRRRRRGDGAGGDRGRRHGRVRGGRAGRRPRAAADHRCATIRPRRAVRCSGWSARRSRSTPAATRSSRRRGCTR